MSAENHTEGGEHPNGRRAMEDMQRRLREGGVSSREAEQRAREIARRHDQGRGAKR